MTYCYRMLGMRRIPYLIFLIINKNMKIASCIFLVHVINYDGARNHYLKCIYIVQPINKNWKFIMCRPSFSFDSVRLWNDTNGKILFYFIYFWWCPLKRWKGKPVLVPIDGTGRGIFFNISVDKLSQEKSGNTIKENPLFYNVDGYNWSNRFCLYV